jgi:hypothetical protein
MVESIHVDGTNLYVFCTNICTNDDNQINDIVELIRINAPSRDCPFPSAIFFQILIKRLVRPVEREGRA